MLCAYDGGLAAIPGPIKLIARIEVLNQPRDLMIRRNGFLGNAPDLRGHFRSRSAAHHSKVA